jgi:ribonuclease VapC
MLEAGIVTVHRGNEHSRLMELVKRTGLEIVTMSEAEAFAGISAFRRYGRGSKHPAKLNFGDCFAYALAKTRNLPLLFKGDDFIHTDIEPALKPA